MKDLGWGLSMTLYGMGTVFLLLIVLMLILLAIGFLDSRSMKKKQNRQEQSAAVEAQPGAAVADEAAEAIEPADLGIEILHDGLTRDQVAAITVAVMIHARVRRAQAAPAMRTYEPGSHLYASRWVTSGRGQQNTSWRRN